MHSRFVTAFVVLLIIIVGLAAGFWVAGYWSFQSAPGSTATSSSSEGQVASEEPPPQVPGWCCKERGGACVEEAEGAVVCLRDGGQLFNRSEEVCNSICKRLQAQ